MAQRHLLRSVVLQTLYERDFRDLSPQESREALVRNAAEYDDTSDTDVSFMAELLSGVIARQSDLDLIIEKAAPEWPIARIALIDRNVLRLGLFELLFGDREKVPAKVAINEAIELAKSFGGEASGRFVNGVLGAVYKELGEPGKDEVSKKVKKDVPFEEMPIERLVGVVVYARAGNDLYLGLVHDVFGHWTLCKGKLLPEETPEAGVVRKVADEIALSVTAHEKIGENEYVASDPEIGKKRRQVQYFIAEAPFKEIELVKKGGLDDARWFRVTDALGLNFYEDLKPIVTKAVSIISAQQDAAETNNSKD